MRRRTDLEPQGLEAGEPRRPTIESPHLTEPGGRPEHLAMDAQDDNVERLLKARAEIEAELRRHKTAVSVLFTDVVGSTAYFDRYGDTAGLALLERHSDLAGQIIGEFRGHVLKKIGDSVMAAFPEPSYAVRAAIEVQRRLLQLNQTLPDRERLQLRIGINHGAAFLHGHDFFGDAVNVAARITKLAGPAQILVSHSVREGIWQNPEFRLVPAGKEPMKGKPEKEEIYEVTWTDTGTYSQLRRSVTEALKRGDLVSPGDQLDQLLGSEPWNPPPSEPSVSRQPLPPVPEGVTARFQILGGLGSGGMGIVYKAKDRETGAGTGRREVTRPPRRYLRCGSNPLRNADGRPGVQRRYPDCRCVEADPGESDASAGVGTGRARCSRNSHLEVPCERPSGPI